jgi:hypothetical protein
MHQISKEFVVAGRAVFTLASAGNETKPAKHYTYKVKKQKDRKKPGQFIWIVQLLTGPDNTSSYTYLGVLNPVTGAVYLGGKSSYNDDSQPVRVIRWAFNDYIWPNRELPMGYTAWHEGKCGRCGRALTVPRSISLGIGPECEKKI